MTAENYPKSRLTELVVQELKGELLIYNLTGNKAFCLNAASASTWQLCDGQTSIAEIAQKLSKKFETQINEDFVRLALDQLQRNDLIEADDRLKIELPAVSRREMIKRVGIGALALLPVIAIVTVPIAAQKGSCPPGSPGLPGEIGPQGAPGPPGLPATGPDGSSIL